jgi:D-beta-D-heptose 7-phosphate kinase/D-beta-D-heptose 1-phosphate adenosyltransferase
LNLIKKYDFEYLIISDYEKWFITPELVREIKKSNNIKIIVDSKKKDVELFAWVYLIKPNFKEFCQSISVQIENEDWEIEKYGKQFVEKYDCNLIITRSEKWASLVTKAWEYFHMLPTKTRDIFDVTWAWDTFTAFTTLALNNWYSIQDAVKKWNEASGIVIGKLGTERVEIGEVEI